MKDQHFYIKVILSTGLLNSIIILLLIFKVTPAPHPMKKFLFLSVLISSLISFFFFPDLISRDLSLLPKLGLRAYIVFFVLYFLRNFSQKCS